MASAQGKTAIITGAAGGLGKAIADAFLAAGANVVICDVNLQRIASVDEEWAKSYAGKFLAQQADVTDEAAIQKLVDAAVAKFGRLDILVNNAAIMDDFSPVGACSREMWDRVLNVNLNGPFVTTKIAITQFEKQVPTGGVIINIGSNASIYGFQSGAAYTVSKAGVMALTKNTAGFYGDKGIYCVALLLGGMANTNIGDAFAQGMHMEMFQKIQASQSQFAPEKAVPIESVAKYCVFLSDKDIAPSANGSCIAFNKNWPEA
ncbi:3-oxoacyl-[acyl-carrier-protein] reductase FabG [Madurella mycetomatis]|uniref:3-oxoacyl-[acyl-carrier-protein] reductase FabG n=1 Tax=Madurella mycetomatis TaxID=100816 RepID=A0A175W8I6_9PEZI|nr:3-oxoacyl-[acyl-carrier-protein] reductase FabG [Madurella mycetomatis]KXX80046.1 3-oxoacyl-[acyl-carrier-protein] reductase FabG [Madurella mycetomatis]